MMALINPRQVEHLQKMQPSFRFKDRAVLSLSSNLQPEAEADRSAAPSNHVFSILLALLYHSVAIRYYLTLLYLTLSHLALLHLTSPYFILSYFTSGKHISSLTFYGASEWVSEGRHNLSLTLLHSTLPHLDYSRIVFSIIYELFPLISFFTLWLNNIWCTYFHFPTVLQYVQIWIHSHLCEGQGQGSRNICSGRCSEGSWICDSLDCSR